MARFFSGKGKAKNPSALFRRRHFMNCHTNNHSTNMSITFFASFWPNINYITFSFFQYIAFIQKNVTIHYCETLKPSINIFFISLYKPHYCLFPLIYKYDTDFEFASLLHTYDFSVLISIHLINNHDIYLNSENKSYNFIVPNTHVLSVSKTYVYLYISK